MSDDERKIRYVLIEDDPQWKERIQRVFAPLGWVLLAAINTYPGVIASFEQGIPVENGESISWDQVDAAFVDANLSQVINNVHGRNIIQYAKKIVPHVWLVGFSTFSDEPKGMDLRMGKGGILNEANRIHVDSVVRGGKPVREEAAILS